MKEKKSRGPKTTAVHDIKIELSKEGKCFIAFRSELNPVMRIIVSEYRKDQKKLKH